MDSTLSELTGLVGLRPRVGRCTTNPGLNHGIPLGFSVPDWTRRYGFRLEARARNRLFKKGILAGCEGHYPIRISKSKRLRSWPIQSLGSVVLNFHPAW
jgi:hypothetical protein